MGDEPSATSSGGYRFRLADPTNPADAEEVSRVIRTTWKATYSFTLTPSELSTYFSTTLSISSFSATIQEEHQRFILAYAPPSPPLFSPSSPPSTPVSTAEWTPTPGTAAIGVAQLTTDISRIPSCITLPRPIEIQRLYVLPEYHGGGVASALVRQAEISAKKDGGESVFLLTWEKASRALAFYEKYGFVPVGYKEVWVGSTSYRDVVLQKSI